MTYKKLYKIFSNIPPLETERLKLRKVTERDCSDVFEYSSDPFVSRYLLWSEHKSIDYTKEYLYRVKCDYRIGKYYNWAIELKDGELKGKMIGTCGFTSFDLINNCAEIGYVINPKFWGLGIAPEALAKVIEFGFDNLYLHRIEGKYLINNKNSLKVMEKCNMRFEGVLRSSMMVKNNYEDVGVCSILSNEYINHKAKAGLLI